MFRPLPRRGLWRAPFLSTLVYQCHVSDRRFVFYVRRIMKMGVAQRLCPSGRTMGHESVDKWFAVVRRSHGRTFVPTHYAS
jgi:hypothetical protein